MFFTLLPIQRLASIDVNQPNAEETEEDHHFGKKEKTGACVGGFSEKDGPRVEEDDFDVEEDEEHRDPVKFDVEFIVRRSDRIHAAFVGHGFCRAVFLPGFGTQELRENEKSAGEEGGEEKEAEKWNVG